MKKNWSDSTHTFVRLVKILELPTVENGYWFLAGTVGSPPLYVSAAFTNLGDAKVGDVVTLGEYVHKDFKARTLTRPTKTTGKGLSPLS
jgi:hypothetical protein